MYCKWHPKLFEIEGCLWSQKLVGGRFKNHTINKHQKSLEVYQKCNQKGTSQIVFFVVFRSLEPKASQDDPKAPPEPFTRSNLVGGHIFLVCDVLSDLVPD